jgi:hypothetical protein
VRQTARRERVSETSIAALHDRFLDGVSGVAQREGGLPGLENLEVIRA